MAVERVAVVTGANKGIGFATVKLLCHADPGLIVYLTARDVERGEQAVVELCQKFGLTSVRFHQLDVASIDSVRQFAQFLRQNHPQGVSILVNNAGVAANTSAHEGDARKTKIDRENFRTIVGINYFGLVNVAYEIFPLLADGARVVNVSSGSSQKAFNQFSPELQEKFRRLSTVEELSAVMKYFIEMDDEAVVRDGWMTGDLLDQVAVRWGRTGLEILSYGVAKLGVNILTKIYQKRFDESTTQRNVAINACTPGGIKTDMNAGGTKPPEAGADVFVYLATIPQGDTELRGKYFKENKQQADMFILTP